MPGRTSSQKLRKQPRNPAAQSGQAMDPAMGTDADTAQAIALVMPGAAVMARRDVRRSRTRGIESRPAPRIAINDFAVCQCDRSGRRQWVEVWKLFCRIGGS
jgi:hypothetical protein